MAENKVSVILTADTRDLVRGVDQADSRLGRFVRTSDTVQRRMRSMGSAARSVAMTTGKLGLAAGAAAAGGLYAMNRVMSEAVELAGVQERAEAKLQAVLEATGQAAGYSSIELGRMASQMQATTTVGDEVILNGMSILSTFKKVQGEAFERTTDVALDMAEVMGTDLRSVMVQLGKALNDPAGRLSALSRAGVQFTDDQEKMIKGMVEAGETAKAQALILDELESQFGGAAEAARQTYGGMKEAAGNAYGDMLEQLGYVVTKNEFFIGLMGLAEDQFVSWGGSIEDNREYLMRLAKEGVLNLADAIDGTVQVLGFFHLGWLNLKLAADTAIHTMGAGTAQLFDMLRAVVSPLELVYDGMVQLGMLDYNPMTNALDRMDRSLETFAESSHEVAQDTARDIADAKERYATWGGTIDDIRGRIAAIPATQQKSGKKAVSAAAATQKKIQDLHDETAESAEDSTDAWAEYMDAFFKSEEEAVKEFLKNEEEKARIRREFAEKHERITIGQFEFERREIREQARAYEEAGADAVQVAEWRAKELAKINENEAEHYRKQQRKKVLASQDFFGGVALGWREAQRDQETWAQAGYDSVREFASSSNRVLSDVLFDSIRSDMDSLSSYWDSFWSSMLRTMTDSVAQMATQWASSKLIDFGAGFVDGLLSFHTGALRTDEVVAKLQEGEMVIPQRQADAIRQAMSSDGMSQKDYFDRVTGAVSVGSSVSDSLGGTLGQQQQADIQGAIVGSIVSSLGGGIAAGYSNYSKTQALGRSLQSRGFDLSSDAIQSAAMDNAIQGLASGFATQVSSGLIGSVGSYALGVSDLSPEAKITNTAIATALGVTGPAGALAAALSPITALAFSGIMDALGVRSDETVRESLESQLGEIRGRRAFQAAQSFLNDNMPTAQIQPGTIGLSLDGSSGTIDAISLGYGMVNIDPRSGVVSNDEGSIWAGADIGFQSPGKLGQFSDALANEYSDYMSGLQDFANKNGISLGGGSSYGGMFGGDDPYGGGFGHSGDGGSSSGGSGPSGGLGAGGLGGSHGGFGRALGGPVQRGHLYEINERGSEMFLPGQDGSILNAEDTRRMLAALERVASGGGQDAATFRALYTIAKYVKRSARILDKWDIDGMPEVRS